jgi:glycosyltransferase involved in cell wall biosynthesis
MCFKDYRTRKGNGVIHLITRLPLPYHQTLCKTLHESYGGAFVGWFAERANEEFPYRSNPRDTFTQHYLSEVGYARLFKELKADSEAVVLLGGWSSPMTNKTLLMTALLRIPVFVWADHPHPRARGWLFASSRKLYLRILAHLVSGFLACGTPTVEHLVSIGIDRKKVTNFPYWVDVPGEWSLPKRCSDQNVAKQPLRLVAIGRHVSEKQFDVAIQAVALANRTAGRQLAELVLIGDGPDHGRLREIASSVGNKASVRFPGWMESDAVFESLGSADALLVPSQFEPYGVVVVEAMATGRPVLAAASVIAAQDRNEGTSAILFHPSGDIQCLAEQITSLAVNPEGLKEACYSSRATAEKWPPSRAAGIIRTILDQSKRGKILSEWRQTRHLPHKVETVEERQGGEPIERAAVANSRRL